MVSATWMAILGLALGGAGPALAQDAAPKRFVMVSNWAQTPDLARSAELYPKEAMDAQVKTGVGLVECRIGENGALSDCSLLSETPAGLGFGRAALEAAPFLHADLAAKGASIVGGYIDVPLRFNAPPPPALAGDVVVTGKRAKCGDKDQACWQDVAANLWKNYPAQIQTLCTSWKTAATRNLMNYETFRGMTGSPFADFDSAATSDDLKPAQRYVCNYRPAR